MTPYDYTYTPTGNVYQVTDADSGTTTYGYDAIGETDEREPARPGHRSGRRADDDHGL